MYEKKAVKLVVDGPHGAGKDEAIRFLYHLLEERGFNVLVTPELFVRPDPRCCNIGDPKDEVGFMAAEFLFFTNLIYRALHVKEKESDYDFILLNRSARGLKVYLDRCDNDRIIRIMNISINMFRRLIMNAEDIVFYLRLEIEENVKRIRDRYKEFPERKKWKEDEESYMTAIHNGYENYFRHDTNVVVIDVTKKDKEKTAKAMMKELEQMGLLKGAKY